MSRVDTTFTQHSYNVRVVRTVEEVEALRPHWVRMQKHPNADIDFFLKVIDVRTWVIGPYVLVLYKDDQPITILAGRLAEERLDLRFGYWTLYRPRVRCLTFIYGGDLGDCSEENSARLVAEIRAQLARPEFNLIIFDLLSIDSPLYRQVLQCGSFWQRDHFPKPNAHWRITQLSSYEAFVRGRSKNTRKNLKKWPKHLEKEFGEERLQVQWRTRSEELPSLFTEMESISSQTYQRGIGAGFRADEGSRQLLTLAAERGWLRACIVYVDKNPIAFWDGFQYGTTYFGNTNGYLPAYREYRAGHYALLKTIERLCEDMDVHMLDLGFGDAEYKRELSDECVYEASLHLCAPTFRGIWINFARTVILYANLFVQRLLSKYSLLSKVKTTLRHKRTPQTDSAQVSHTEE